MGNKKNRGEKELECINILKNIILRCESVSRYLYLAKSNPKPSEFPDFIFNDGFIEHFQVSSSKETKKGSDFNITENDFNKAMEDEFDKNKKEWLDSDFQNNTMRVTTYKNVIDNGSYEFFVKSFTKNFDKHIASLKNNNGEKSIGIFLVEFLGGKITICQKGIFKEFYKLSYDKDLLEYIYKFKNELKYVIFTDNEHYDVVEVKNIPDIIKSIPKEITFGVGRFTTITTTLFYE